MKSNNKKNLKMLQKTVMGPTMVVRRRSVKENRVINNGDAVGDDDGTIVRRCGSSDSFSQFLSLECLECKVNSGSSRVPIYRVTRTAPFSTQIALKGGCDTLSFVY